LFFKESKLVHSWAPGDFYVFPRPPYLNPNFPSTFRFVQNHVVLSNVFQLPVFLREVQIAVIFLTFVLFNENNTNLQMW